MKAISLLSGIASILSMLASSTLPAEPTIDERIGIPDKKDVAIAVSTSTPLRGKASWYDYSLKDAPNYSRFNSTCASRDYPRGSLLQVTNTKTGAATVCRVNDYVESSNVIVDLSSYAFKKLAPLSLGIVEVELENIACSCIKTARHFGADIPARIDAFDLKSNSRPRIGVLALFRFPSGLYHVGLVREIQEGGFLVVQGNKEPCKITEELVRWGDRNLVGFHSPDG